MHPLEHQGASIQSWNVASCDGLVVLFFCLELAPMESKHMGAQVMNQVLARQDVPSLISPCHHTLGCPTLLDLLSSYLPGTSLAIKNSKSFQRRTSRKSESLGLNPWRTMSILLILVQLSFSMLAVISFSEGLVWFKNLKPSTRVIHMESIDTKNYVVFIPRFYFIRLTLTSSNIWRPKAKQSFKFDSRSYLPGVY